MAKITFIEPDGSERELEVPEGTSIMQAAMDHGVTGIMGDCGGACSCATCHCYIDEHFIARLPAANSLESSMLDFATELKPNSRLGCQVTISEEISGLVVRLPESQY